MHRFQRTRAPFATPKPGKKPYRTTTPGRDPGIREQIAKYNAGTLADRIGAYYEDQFDFPGEDDVVDFAMLTHLEKLDLLARKRKEIYDLRRSNPELFDPGANADDPQPTE